ncbi:Dehydrodolichyl diphosphate synthase [Trachymyrmex septentrionalis]|uniref:Alkyl transferase n=1 Tax=Trachymyrmex septentrionalis TaxID=34720 RepID=A0A195ETV0_9HYME|nr:Dehydrodolichyl diphosphate synthase [Trachymyrmex septentrionalis]
MSWLMERILNWFQFLVLKVIKTGEIPKHVAFIMDGSRRYAKKQNLTIAEGHSKGFDKMIEMLNWCMYLGIVEVTLYAFSIENFKRSKEEVDNLMHLARQNFKVLLKDKKKLKDNEICFRVIGNLSLIPEDICKLIAEVIIITRENNRMFINFAVAYTSRDEITHAIKDIIQGVKDADILPEDINEDLITDCLYTYKSPYPDLLIRTSGETRLSDFLTWQISNTCIYFTKTFYRRDSHDARTFVESLRWSTQSVQAFSRSHEWRATSSSSCRPRDDGSKRSTAIAVVRRELVGCKGVVFQGGTGADGSCGEGVRERRSEHENEQQRVQGNRRRSD